MKITNWSLQPKRYSYPNSNTIENQSEVVSDCIALRHCGKIHDKGKNGMFLDIYSGV